MTDNAFVRALGELSGAGQEGVALRASGEGETHVIVAGVPITMVCREDDPDTVITVARVGSTKGLLHPELPLEDALEANFLWMGNAGSTLSLDPENGDLVLHDRRDAVYFESADVLKGYLAAFADTVIGWQGHFDRFRGTATGEDGAGKEVAS